MSLHQDAQATILIGDFINTDVGGKVNAIGAGFQIMGLMQPQAVTAPFSLLVLIDVPQKYAGDEFAVSIELRDETLGKVVSFAGQGGQAEALRFQQIVLAQKPAVPNVYIPDVVPCRAQLVLAFGNGLQLQPNHTYAWRLEVEGQTKPNWRSVFYIAGPPPGPVVGGPVGNSPTDIPPLTPDPS